ncbi:GGDEF domain-containing protein [Vibrio aestuarianus]|uniref:GGDEF domain-containing protein n=1 Tax=Vibrio aestuarianus TaxID=28171 RepID=UPI00237CB2EC|nr:GGDEF domain-containing protein [Vibrio aestuarianus]MDE1223486.1 GGDEF domain-containing protein [Vibrio aestuarianus]MDE1340270.1 GGDEF domain-containing protein [Vibrio aestuarianus]
MTAFPRFLVGLMLLTVIIVVTYLAIGDQKVLKITPSQYSFHPTNDQFDGGLSTSELSLQNGQAHLSCDLLSSNYQWPYCGISIHANDDPRVGLDLSDYHTVRLSIDFTYSQSASPPAIRFYLRNFNHEYSTIENEYTHKYNGLEFSLGDKSEIEIPMANLQVMTWWLVDNRIGIEHSAPEFSNVNKIEFATGSGSELGHYEMHVNSVEFIGAYVNGEHLFLFLLSFWMLVGLSISFNEMRKSRHEAQLALQRQEHLKIINRTLRSQNIKFAEMAHRDSLTGALNRNGIREWLNEYAHKVRWSDTQFCMLYIDIDHFKRVNDSYGHSTGDDILREFAMVTISILPEKDRLVRWGGEEFIVFCVDTSLQEACARAEKLRRRVEAHLWVHGDKLTCSIGVAMMGDERITEMIARADDALYQAKNKGRNRVEINYGLVQREAS